MKSFFAMSFQNQFRGDVARGFRPATGLGQIYTSFDDLPSSGGLEPAPAQDPVKPAGASDTDWAKILAEGIKGAAAGYGVYSQGQIAKMKAEYDLLRAKNPSAIPPLQTQTSKTTTIALVLGGVAVLGLIAVVALK